MYFLRCECLLLTQSGHQNGPLRIHRRGGRLSAAALLMNEDMPKASSKSLGVFVPSAGLHSLRPTLFYALVTGVTQNLIMLFPRSKRLFLQRKEELVMTQFMKLLLAGTITGVVMMTAAIGTAAAAGPENRITILYDAFGKDASMRKD
jgi:hypothetical protein